MTRLLKAMAAVIAVSSFTGAVQAKPSLRVNTKYYSISGTTAAQLKAQMRSKGPKGKWAYTKWYVRWSGNCRLSVSISYTYPRWANNSQASRPLQQSWHRMMARLRVHERGHARHGINAATEIERAGCKGNPASITSKWARQDKIYDRQTRSGITQGVVLN